MDKDTRIPLVRAKFVSVIALLMVAFVMPQDARAIGTGPPLPGPLVPSIGLPSGGMGECMNDAIGSVALDGSTISLLSGGSFSVSETDRSTAASWLIAERVTVCYANNSYDISNEDEGNEHIDAVRIF